MECLRHHKKKYFLQKVSKRLPEPCILGGLFPTVSYNGLHRHFTWNRKGMELEQKPVKKDALETAYMRVLKLLFPVFISTPLIKILKIISSKLYLQEKYTTIFPISTLPLSVYYHLFFIQLLTHLIIFEPVPIFSSFRVISSCLITACILLLIHSTAYHIKSA